MARYWIAIAAIIIAAALFSGCCGIQIPGFGGTTHATIGGLTGKDGSTITNGGTTTQRVQHIAGTADNPGGKDATTFKGRIAVMLNGVKQYVTASTRNEDGTWNYGGDFVIRRGENKIQVQVENEDGSVYGTSETFTVNGDLPPRQLESVLTWDTDDNDVDMHVWSPGGLHAYYSAKSAIPGCYLDVDDTDGYGPETFVCENTTMESGQWTIKIRYYSAHGVASSVPVTVRVSRNEGAAQTFTHTFTEDQANTDNSDNDWTVIQFNVP